MPVLEIEIVIRPGEILRATLAKELADAAAAVLISAPGGTWVRLRTLAPDRYAEGPGLSPAVFPVFIEVLKAAVPDADAMQAEVTQLTSIFSGLLDRPKENVHVIYVPAGRGRVAFGGNLLKE